MAAAELGGSSSIALAELGQRSADDHTLQAQFMVQYCTIAATSVPLIDRNIKNASPTILFYPMCH
jgi:hypothetical protein